ncbi:MAG: hypothetical protein K2K97_12585, partial [Muribaculaceae bacterium]|nr:hypothetical protein [Muribaculaceae bacterium]
MPYKNGKVYHATVNGVKYGASDLDVAKALGTTNLNHASLCAHRNVNMWAMFKPMVHSIPQPYTNEERMKKQWGLSLPTMVPSHIPSPSQMPPQWTYPRASDWCMTADFAGDNEYEGYAPDAGPVVTVEMRRSGSFVTVVFKFNDGDDGGIPPEKLIVPNVNTGSSGNTTMADLYPGVIIYKWESSSGGYFRPIKINTTDKNIGKNRQMVMDTPISFLGSGDFAVVPIFSNTIYAPGQAPSASQPQVLPAHESMLTLAAYDSDVSGLLFSRRDVGLSRLGVNNGTGYFQYSGNMPNEDNYISGELHNYYWTFTSNSGLSLITQDELKQLVETDRRIS